MCLEICGKKYFFMHSLIFDLLSEIPFPLGDALSEAEVKLQGRERKSKNQKITNVEF